MFLLFVFTKRRKPTENVNILLPYKLVVFKEPFANLDKQSAWGHSLVIPALKWHQELQFKGKLYYNASIASLRLA